MTAADLPRHGGAGLPSKALHLLWVSDSPTTPSGFGNVTRFVCEGLAQRGHDVHVLTREMQQLLLRAAGRVPADRAVEPAAEAKPG